MRISEGRKKVDRVKQQVVYVFQYVDTRTTMTAVYIDL